MTREDAKISLDGMLCMCEEEHTRIFERLWADKHQTESEKQVDMFRWWNNHGIRQGLRVALFHLSQLSA